ISVLPGVVEDAVNWFAHNVHPDLIFLDIHLSDGNSFDFLSQAVPTSVIIFTTAYDQYAIRAFSVNSIDYILKPIGESRLLEAILKFESINSKKI
ncbi:MAG: response regulator, partial [Muribaculaceae bacterium]